jgi:hypothetical protein
MHPNCYHISIRHHDDRVGEIVVHLPRAGFAVTQADKNRGRQVNRKQDHEHDSSSHRCVFGRP